MFGKLEKARNLLLICSHSRRQADKRLFACGAYAVFIDKFGQIAPIKDWLWNTIYLNGLENVEVHQGKSYVLF